MKRPCSFDVENMHKCKDVEMPHSQSGPHADSQKSVMSNIHCNNKRQRQSNLLPAMLLGGLFIMILFHILCRYSCLIQSTYISLGWPVFCLGELYLKAKATSKNSKSSKKFKAFQNQSSKATSKRCENFG